MVAPDDLSRWTTLTADDIGRWEFTRLVHRISMGRWQDDLRARIRQIVGSQRAEAWRTADGHANLLQSVVLQLAKLYDRPPTVYHPDEAAAAHIARINESGIWPMMQAYMAEILAMREGFIRVDIEQCPWTQEHHLTFRVVYPYEVIVRCSPGRPDRPIEIREIREREFDGKKVRAWDVLSIDPRQGGPFYRVLMAENGRDVTEAVLGQRYEGEAYPYRDGRGVPVLPYALYRANKTGRMWNVWSSSSIVEGTINIAVKYSFLQHVELQAAWAQRYGIDVDLPEADWVDDDNNGVGHRAVVTDPTKIELFQSLPEKGSPTVGAFPVPVSPRDMIETIIQYERRLISLLGIETPEGIRVHGTPTSGYAVSVSRDAQREAQRRYTPTFREGDLELLRIAAVLWNRATGDSVPEDGYEIAYAGIGLSKEEAEARVNLYAKQIELGLLDRVSALMDMHPGMSEAEALERARLYAERERMFLEPLPSPARSPEPTEAEADTPHQENE